MAYLVFINHVNFFHFFYCYYFLCVFLSAYPHFSKGSSTDDSYGFEILGCNFLAPICLKYVQKYFFRKCSASCKSISYLIYSFCSSDKFISSNFFYSYSQFFFLSYSVCLSFAYFPFKLLLINYFLCNFWQLQLGLV